MCQGVLEIHTLGIQLMQTNHSNIQVRINHYLQIQWGNTNISQFVGRFSPVTSVTSTNKN